MKHPKIPMDDGWNQPELQAKGPGQILAGHQDMTSAAAWAYSVGLERSLATVECRGRAPWSGGLGRANSKRIRVTSLTFLGRVTSSATWPFFHSIWHFLLVVLWN